jgi:TonB-dependent starch-binding outer membrane protein SusC
MRKLVILFFLLCFLLPEVLAQQNTISGTVTGPEDKTPLIGATVQLKAKTSGTVTGLGGKYSINASKGDTLEFRYVGMKVKDLVVDTSAIIDVMLEYEVIGVNDVIIVGYGTQTRTKVTSSISKVDGVSIKNLNVQSVEQALQGKSAGVYIESSTGKSSSAIRMRIRGSASINATCQPLFVVDGIPLSTETLNLAGGLINPMATINYNDIESVDILKDAASASIYGSRGSNGVVLITTKKGISGDTKLDFTIQSGFNEASHRREFMNSDEYIYFMRESGVNADSILDVIYGYPAGTSTENQFLVEETLKRNSGWAAKLDENGHYLGSEVSTDWQDQIFRRGKIFSAEMSARGGSDNLKYFTSVSYNKNEGIMISNGMEKISARLNIDDKVTKNIDMGFTLSLNRTDIDHVDDDNSYATPISAVSLYPITPPRDLEGNIYSTPTIDYYNPLIDVEDATRNIIEYRSLANAYLTFRLMDGLKWRNEIGFDLYNLKENNRYGKLTYTGSASNGTGFFNYGQTQNFIAKSYLDFLKSFEEINLSAVLGTEFQYVSVDNAWARGEQFPLDELSTLASAGFIAGASSTLSEYSFLSYFTRINMDYRSKYLITLSDRIDGSSRFGESNRYGQFPSVSFGWVLSEEDFLPRNSTLNFLKVRTSYGLTGNSSIGNYKHLGLYGAGSYNNVSGLVPTQLANPDLGWESTKQFGMGVDFGLFKNRISGEIDYYIKNTKDLLLDVPVPSTSGYTLIARNAGSIENRGFEFVLNTLNLTGRFTWNTNLNISFNKNKVTDLDGQTIIDKENFSMPVVMLNYPISEFYGAQYAGVNPANGDAIWYVNEKDANGNIVNPGATTNDFSKANFVPLGNPNPPFIGAITNTLEYKGFGLDFTFQGVAGNKIELLGDSFMAMNGNWFDNELKSQLGSWKKPGDITDIPQARLGFGNGNQIRSSRYLSDGSYIKLRTIILSYQLPQKIAEKIGLDRIRISVQGQNLLTFTKNIGWDPEVNSDMVIAQDRSLNNARSGIGYFSPPQPRSIIFTINIGL